MNSVLQQLTAAAVCLPWLHEPCLLSGRKKKQNLQRCSRLELLRHVYDRTTTTEIARLVKMSVHVETAGLASTPASRFCTAGIGSGHLRSSVGGRRRSPYVDNGAPAVDTGGEPGDTYRRTTAQGGQNADECCVVVLSDRQYLSRRCRIPQTAHQRQRSQIMNAAIFKHF